MNPFINHFVATFRSADEKAETRNIDITRLNNDASINSLCKNNPFMYYSVFKPTGNHEMEAANHVADSVMVKRKRHISVKCHVWTVMKEIMARPIS